jgi:branched-chain amino acid transport system substrate-binding protein
VRGRLAVSSCAFVACVLGLVACGGGGGGGGGGAVSGKTLTIYSSLPLQGSSRVQGKATTDGIKLALKQVGYKVGGYTIKYHSLDDSTAQAGKWDPGQTSANARKAVGDKSTILYIGEFNSGASAISIPILNRAGIGQISPSNTDVGLTVALKGATEPGAPQKYYPTGKRTYVRVVPKDTIQGAALATVMKGDGCKKPYILNDKEVYGQGLGVDTALALKSNAIPALGNDGWDPKAANYRTVASKLAGKGVDCVVLSGIVNNNAVQLTKDLGAGTKAKIYGPDGVCTSTYSSPKQGGIPTSLDNRVVCTVATLSPKNYPPAGKKFFSDFKATYGHPVDDPYALYGYESASLGLDAIKRAGNKGNDRAAVVSQLFATKSRPSVLGTYSIDKNGDTSLTDYGLYKIINGNLTFDRVVKAKGAAL